VRLPTGRPFGFPDCPGCHMRPFTCLVGSRAICFCFLLLIGGDRGAFHGTSHALLRGFVAYNRGDDADDYSP
jgi:hypothetical protein